MRPVFAGRAQGKLVSEPLYLFASVQYSAINGQGAVNCDDMSFVSLFLVRTAFEHCPILSVSEKEKSFSDNTALLRHRNRLNRVWGGGAGLRRH
jgi:hypothetical protein